MRGPSSRCWAIASARCGLLGSRTRSARSVAGLRCAVKAANPRLPPMAKRPATPAELRDAVERTVQSTLGSAERQRGRTVDNLRSAAGAVARGRKALEDARPANHEDIRELKAELRRIGRRLDAIEERLPAKRAAAKRPSGKRSSSK